MNHLDKDQKTFILKFTNGFVSAASTGSNNTLGKGDTGWRKLLFHLDVDLMSDINPQYLQKYNSAEKVRDFIAGMTDDFFLKQAESFGCRVPEKK